MDLDSAVASTSVKVSEDVSLAMRNRSGGLEGWDYCIEVRVEMIRCKCFYCFGGKERKRKRKRKHDAER